MFWKIMPPQGRLMNYILGKWISKPIYVATKLAVADHLSDGPKGVDELARLCDCHEESLYRLLRALASIDIFKEVDSRRFDLTPMAALLKRDEMASSVLMFHSEWSEKAWSNLYESVKTGTSAFELAYGEPIFEWFQKNPKDEQIFNEANAIKARNFHRHIVKSYNFSSISKIYDVGGGLGSLTFEILDKSPRTKGCIADLPSVVKQTAHVIKEQGLEGRCTVEECDFFQEVPSGGDAYILSNILHDWTDEQCAVILANLSRAMTNDAKLLIAETLVPLGNKPSRAKFLDIEMMVSAGGRERTKAEFEKLFNSAGFILKAEKKSRFGISLMECVKG